MFTVHAEKWMSEYTCVCVYSSRILCVFYGVSGDAVPMCKLKVAASLGGEGQLPASMPAA